MNTPTYPNDPLMNRVLRYLAGLALLASLALGLAIEAQGQITPIADEYELVARYGIERFGDGTKTTIAQAYATGQTPQAAFPNLYARYYQVGWTDAQIGRLTPLVAAYEDLVWGTNPLPVIVNGKPYPNGSRIRIKLGNGKWAVNYPLTGHFGSLSGTGCGYVYPDARSPRGYGGTTLEAWPEQWIDDAGFGITLPDLGSASHRIGALWRSATWGQEGTVGAYHEIGSLKDIHFRGPALPEFQSGRLWVGAVGWDMGSGSLWDNLYSTGLDVGVMFVRGTPVELRKLTAMNGNVAAILLVGTAGNIFSFGTVEVDDYPCVLMARAGFSREAGGLVAFHVIKIETGVTPESRGPWKYTIVADVKGQGCMDFGKVSVATAFVKTSALFVVDPRLVDGTPQSFVIKAMVKRFDCNADAVHVVGGPVYANTSAGAYGSSEILWTTSEGCTINGRAIMPIANVTGAARRLGGQRWVSTAWSPAFNHATGTPAYVYGTAVAPVPVPLPTPTPTPAPTAPVYSSTGSVSVTSPNYSVGLTAPVTVKRIVLTGYKLAYKTGEGPNYSSFAVGTDGSYISIYPDGSWNIPSGKAQVTTTSTTTTITLPTAYAINRLGTFAGQGGALTYTASKVELYP